MTIGMGASPRQRAPRSPLPFPRSQFTVTLLVLLLLLLFHEEITSAPRVAAGVASGTLLIVALVQRPVVRRRGMTVGLTYLLLLGLFHCGLLLPYALSGSVRMFNNRDTAWVYGPLLGEAAWVAAVGIAAFGVGYAILSRTPPPDDAFQPIDLSERPAGSQGAVGLALFVAGLAGWVYWSLQGGGLVLGGSYLDYLARTSGTPLPYTYLAMGLGLPMAAPARPAVRNTALALFILWAGPAFLLGLRGEVILPLAAFLVVAARYRRIPLLWVAGGGVALLCLGSFVRGFRTTDLGARSVEWAAFNPLDGIAELGYSIRPVVTVMGWRATGDPDIGLDTYLNPVLRLVSRFVGTHAPAVLDDPSALSTSVRTRVGPIGGSTIAEAYRAQGLLSLLLVLVLTGLVCGVLDNLPAGQVWDAITGGAAIILFLWIRNDFVPVPAQLVVMAVIVWGASLLPNASQARTRRKSPRVGHAP